MLTRLKVSGFKNLVDVDVRFGPFTCIAGANGVGKSNLFDAIQFLSALADHTLFDAARMILRDKSPSGDIRQLFHRVGDEYSSELSFEVEMIISSEGMDDLGQPVTIPDVFQKYSLTLNLQRLEAYSREFPSLEIVHEDLSGLPNAPIDFAFSRIWRESLYSQKYAEAFTQSIYTDTQEPSGIFLNPRSGNNLPGRYYSKKNLPRTVLSSVVSADYSVPMLVRREMQSWRIFQLDPSALREPSSGVGEGNLQTNGARLAAALYRLTLKDDPDRVYAQVSNRLAELLDDIRRVWVDRDDARNLLTLMVEDKRGTAYPASSLSDGTLRFLALVIMSMDANSGGIVCLEEPENGIHPARIPALLDILQQTAVDTSFPVGYDNPLRQVIINTHAPAVVQQVPDDSLLVADLAPLRIQDGTTSTGIRFSALRDTWRTRAETQPKAALGDLLAFLVPSPSEESENGVQPTQTRVADREDIRHVLAPTVE